MKLRRRQETGRRRSEGGAGSEEVRAGIDVCAEGDCARDARWRLPSKRASLLVSEGEGTGPGTRPEARHVHLPVYKVGEVGRP